MKQGQYKPLPMVYQVVTIYMYIQMNNYAKDIPLNQIVFNLDSLNIHNKTTLIS